MMVDDGTVVFVYGTLRPRQPNYPVTAGGVTDTVSAHGHGLRLFNATHHGFPYATPGPTTATVVGALLTLHPDRYTNTLRRLDYLEGYDPDRPDRGHYLRRRHTFTTDEPSRFGPAGTTVDAWIYLAGPRTRPGSLRLIPTGDWLHPTNHADRIRPCVACSV